MQSQDNSGARPAIGAEQQPTAGPQRFKNATMRFWARHKIPIAYKMAFAISVLIVLGMTGLGAVIVYNQTQVLRSEMQALGHTVVTQAAESAKDMLLADDTLGLSVLATNLTSDRSIHGVAILDADGRILAREGVTPLEADGSGAREFLPAGGQSSPFEWERTIPPDSLVSFVAPVQFRDVTAGYALVTFSRNALQESLRDSVRAIVAATVTMILLAVIISFALGKRLASPIDQLVHAGKAIDDGQLDYRFTAGRNDEIGELMAQFNSMADGLLRKNQVEETFSRFVPNKVASQVLRDLENVELGGSHMTGTVLFADISGYTEMTRKLSPSDTAQLLNEYFAYISRASALYHGIIDKFMGDCAMVVFGIPDQDEEHCFHAVACAVLIQRLVERLNAMRAARGLFPVSFRIGINTGEMLAGNLGSPERMQYTVVGDAVNLASRLCDIARPGEVVISETVIAGTNAGNPIAIGTQRAVAMKHMPEPVSAYTVTSLGSKFDRLIQCQLEEVLAESEVA